MKNLLSIIVPVFNTEKYLSQCIESIRNQTMSEIEIILVDDGSTDNSAYICDEFSKKDTRIKVFHQKNQGPIAARKKGLKECRGEYVTFVDSDDFIDKVSFALAKKSMQNGVDLIVFGICRYFDETVKNYQKCQFKKGLYKKKDIQNRLWPSMIWDYEKGGCGLDPSLCTKIVKKELLLSVYQKMSGRKFHYGEDVAVLYPLMLIVETLEIMDECYYFHRQRGRKSVAGYIADDKYLDKLFQLYTYLVQEFNGRNDFIKQIEYFYMDAVDLRKRSYGDYVKAINYLFPFDKINKNERIILYGAGAVGQNYMAQIKKIHYCNVVLWVDKNFRRYTVQKIVSPDKIKTTAFDKIVIAVNHAEIKKQIKSDLITSGVEEIKIV